MRRLCKAKDCFRKVANDPYLSVNPRHHGRSARPWSSFCSSSAAGHGHPSAPPRLPLRRASLPTRSEPTSVPALQRCYRQLAALPLAHRCALLCLFGTGCYQREEPVEVAIEARTHRWFCKERSRVCGGAEPEAIVQLHADCDDKPTQASKLPATDSVPTQTHFQPASSLWDVSEKRSLPPRERPGG